MKTYIGVKLIQAEPAQKHTCTTADCAEGIEGYKYVWELLSKLEEADFTFKKRKHK